MLTLQFARIKPGKEERLRAWLAELSARKAEALQSLAQEGTRQEQCYILPGTGGEGAVLVYAMDTDDARGAISAYGRSQLAIDVEHRAVLAEVLQEPLDLEPLYDCARP
jgi:hypothetical protein